MNFPTNNDWHYVLSEELNKEYFKNLLEKIELKYSSKIVFPKKENIFNAFKLTSFKDVRVVMIGQDPYHGENQAHGLAFSVKNDRLPPSLKNIFKELKSDLKIEKNSGDLTSWSKQGVLLLNTILTVEKGRPLSHKNIGWEIFTDNVIKTISLEKKGIIFVLWGNNAIEKEYLIDKNKHYVIKSSHPSPFSANKGFFGSKPFSKINNILDQPIEW